MIAAALAGGDHVQLGAGVFLGVAFGLFMALMWMRLWRWFFGLMGLRA